MKNFSILFLGITTLALSPLSAQSKPPEAVEAIPTARSKTLELIGAFANDGYKARDGYWLDLLEPGKPRFFEVNLFSGNEYWFCAAALAPARKIDVSVYDEAGKLIEGQTYEDGPSAAAGIEPPHSGRYFVKIQMLEGEKTEGCFVYCYK